MELNSDNRKKRMKIWISKEERILLDAKAEHYGYKNLSSYIRDSAIYEKVTYFEPKNKEEIYLEYSKNTEELKKIAKEIRHISRYATQMTKDELNNINIMMATMLKNQKNIIKLIDKKLDLDVWKEINHFTDIKCLENNNASN